MNDRVCRLCECIETAEKWPDIDSLEAQGFMSDYGVILTPDFVRAFYELPVKGSRNEHPRR